MNTITVILNCYKRPEHLQEQIQAVRDQTVVPTDIWIWYNKPEDGEQYDLSALGCKVVSSNHNFKFHGRFAFGLLAQTEYVAFFDDDTIPGPEWFRNCLDTIEGGYDGILGTTGIYLQSGLYNPHSKIGWNGVNSKDTIEVDLVGHAWFMKKDYLRYMWYEEPVTWDNGEDIQLSYLAYKHGRVKTYVPPHPSDDQSGWGSQYKKGAEYGNDKVASHKKANHSPLRDKIVASNIKNGYITVKNRS